jgi:hypothetical protein
MTLPQAPLIDQISPQAVPTEGGSVADLQQLVDSPESDFLMTIITVLDDMGILDETFGDIQGDVLPEDDTSDELSREQIELLLGKFKALPPETQESLAAQMQQEAPDIFQKIQAGLRLVG